MLMRGCDTHSDNFNRFLRDYKIWQEEVFKDTEEIVRKLKKSGRVRGIDSRDLEKGRITADDYEVLGGNKKEAEEEDNDNKS